MYVAYHLTTSANQYQEENPKLRFLNKALSSKQVTPSRYEQQMLQPINANIIVCSKPDDNLIENQEEKFASIAHDLHSETYVSNDRTEGYVPMPSNFHPSRRILLRKNGSSARDRWQDCNCE